MKFIDNSIRKLVDPCDVMNSRQIDLSVEFVKNSFWRGVIAGGLARVCFTLAPVPVKLVAAGGVIVASSLLQWKATEEYQQQI